MPNDTTVRLDVEDYTTLSSLEDFKNSIVNPTTGDIDFEIVAPMPDILRNSAKGRRSFTDPATGEHIDCTTWYQCNGVERPFTSLEKAELSKLGCDSWYDWAVQNWGTKWNAYDSSYDEQEFLSYGMSTAWSPPEEWALALSRKHPDVEFRLSYIDEGWGYAGYQTYSGGAVTDEIAFDCEEDTKEFREFCEDLVGEYLFDNKENNDDDS